MISIRPPEVDQPLHPRITVIGVGGAGGNAVNNMIRSNLEGVEFLVCNTDAQALGHSAADRRIQLGLNITKGLGAGSRPEVGRASAEEALEELFSYLEGSNMVFITAGMGGGTGTGAAPVIARAAREHNILTVGVVTKPFQFEGAHRMRTAEAGIQELQQFVDTLIVIPNQNLFRIANEKTTFADAFKMADEVLYSGVRGVTDLMVMPGLINLDFADIRTVMSEMGKAMMGTGEAEGARRAIDAAEAAISNPLLDEVSLKGARAMLINITAGMDIALFEVDEAVNRVRSEVDPDANVIFGSTFDPTMEGRLRVSVVATGIDAQSATQAPPARQPTLDVIRGGADVNPVRKAQPGGFAASLGAQGAGWPAAAGNFGAQAGATAAIARSAEPAFETQAFEIAAFETRAEIAADAPSARTAEPRETIRIVEPAPRPFAQAEQPRPEEPEPMPSRPGDAGVPPGSAPASPTASLSARSSPFAAQPIPAPEKKRTYSLFERATGAARRAEQASAAQAQQTPARAAPSFGPGWGTKTPARPASPEAAVIPAGQPRLGIDAPTHGKAPTPHEDLLEIPAFLRRQAN
jgi:cell division protein FtsZ